MAVMTLEEEIKKREALFATQPRGEPLSESVRRALKNYFIQLKGEEPKGFYPLILAEVEVPLLEFLVKATKNNHVRMARMLGLNRVTVRKKLKTYNLML